MEANLLLEAYLKQLHLPGFLRSYRAFAADAAHNNEDPVRYLLALAEQEVRQREQNRQRERIKQARFPVLRELADFDFSAVPSLNNLPARTPPISTDRDTLPTGLRSVRDRFIMCFMTQRPSSRRPTHSRGSPWILLILALLVVIIFSRGWLTTPAPPAVSDFQAGEITAAPGASGDGFEAGALAAELPDPTRISTPRPTSWPSVTPQATATPDDGLPVIAFAKLPRQAQDTIRLIDRGGPFPYRQDGTVFQNRERLLPRHPSGYYREYTVVTPGESDRGARRIVAGAEGELYYTADHYASFKRVVR